MKQTLRALCAAMALTACVLPLQASAQAYPSRPIRIIVPFGAGSGSDLLARVVGDKLAEQLKVPVVVDNRDGAGGVIGTQAAAKSAPDGYTIVLVSNAVAIAPLLYSPMPFDPIKDFVPIAKVGAVPLVVLTGNTTPYRTLQEMFAYLKANPTLANYASSGKGSQSHLEAAQMVRNAGLTVPDVPYKVTGQAMTDTIAGQVNFYLAGIGPAMPQYKAGKIRILAYGGPKRSPALPDVPTFAEATGIAGYEVGSWFGFLAPAGTPPEIVNKLADEIAKTTESPQVRERMAGISAEVALATPAQFATQLRAESDKWTALVKALNIKAE